MTTGILTTSFPRRSDDFAGCFVEDAASALAATGERVEVIAAGPASGAGGEDSRPDLAPGIRVLRVAMPTVESAHALFFSAGAPEILERGGFGAWMQAACFWAGLCTLTRDRSRFWNRIVAHWLVPCALAARAVAPHLPLTAHAHSGDIALLERIPGGRLLGRWLARETVDLVFVSADLRERFAKLTGVTVGRVEPAMQPDRFGVGNLMSDSANIDSRQATRRGLGLDRRTVLSVGRLVPIKGFDILLRAVALASGRDRASPWGSVTVVVLGDGPERTRLESLARRLGVDLRLPGFVPRDEVARWMQRADLYVQPSRQLPSGRTEGLPIATLEAARAGLPIVVAATGGLRELPGIYGFDSLQLRRNRGEEDRWNLPPIQLFAPGDAGDLAASLIVTGV